MRVQLTKSKFGRNFVEVSSRSLVVVFNVMLQNTVFYNGL